MWTRYSVWIRLVLSCPDYNYQLFADWCQAADLNVKNIESLFFSSNDKGVLYLIFWFYFGLLVITAISLINLELVVPGVQYIDYNQLYCFIPAVASSITKLNPYYITGFADGESVFWIGIDTNTKLSAGYRVKASFQIGLHEKDRALLELIKAYFGVGKITKQGQESIQFRVFTIKELKVIISHFENIN